MSTTVAPRPPAKPHAHGQIDPSAPWPLRALMAVYRFLASVKLAVITIASLAVSLAAATLVEKWYGSKAGQEVVYESRWFAILLAFLATNILCAATIRFPWKRRQTGFVVTHAGLLILIFGAWWGFRFSDEGKTAATEGNVMDQMILPRNPVVRVRELDRTTGRPGGEYRIPFQGGAFPWPSGKAEVISDRPAPFTLEVAAYYPASGFKLQHEAAKGGMPMVRLGGRAKPPRLDRFVDLFSDAEDSWFVIPRKTMGYRIAHRAGGAKIAFLYVDRPEMVEDFVRPPANPGLLGIVRFRYRDASGKPLVHEARLDDLTPERPFPLPGSDLKAAFVQARHAGTPSQFKAEFGDDEIYMAKFRVRKGDGPELDHLAFAGQPMSPPLALTAAEGGRQEALVALSYYRPPMLDAANTGNAGTLGVIEVLGTDKGELYYRIFSRDEALTTPEATEQPRPGVLKKPPAPMKLRDRVVAFGGGPTAAMTLEIGADEYLTAGEEKETFVPIDLPEGSKDEGRAAALFRLTVGGETKEVWLPHGEGMNASSYTPVRFANAVYEIAYDYERKPFGFSLTLDRAESGFYPGTQGAKTYTSEVRLNDERARIVDRPYKIEMNKPLTHGKFTFYQSGMDEPVKVDPRTGRRTKELQSILAVGHDAGREIKYFGCALVVLGTFLQFYMRAGVSTLFRRKPAPETSAEAARRRLAEKASKSGPRSGNPDKPAGPPLNHDDAIL